MRMIQHKLLSVLAVAVLAASAFAQDDPALDKILAAVTASKEAHATALADGQQKWRALTLDYQAKQADAQAKDDEVRSTLKAVENLTNSRQRLLADPALVAEPRSLSAALSKIQASTDALNGKLPDLSAAAILAAAESDVAHAKLDDARAMFDALQNQRCVPCDELADYVATQAAKKKVEEPSVLKPAVDPLPGAEEVVVEEDVIVDEDIAADETIIVDDPIAMEDVIVEQDFVADEDYIIVNDEVIHDELDQHVDYHEDYLHLIRSGYVDGEGNVSMPEEGGDEGRPVVQGLKGLFNNLIEGGYLDEQGRRTENYAQPNYDENYDENYNEPAGRQIRRGQPEYNEEGAQPRRQIRGQPEYTEESEDSPPGRQVPILGPEDLQPVEVDPAPATTEDPAPAATEDPAPAESTEGEGEGSTEN